MIVSHDSGFLDRVCTHIIHYETRKLVTYKGNLTEFIRQCPAAKKYTELSNDELKFIFPVPGFLEGVKNKDKAIVKANNCHFTYPNTDRQIISGASIQLSLRVACLGPNGAGKSTFIKLLTGEAEPDIGTVWRHPNMRYATSRSTPSTTSSSTSRRLPTSTSAGASRLARTRRTSPR